ncbi:Transposase [Madurella fahalii]|uniref:Transposase n=1 Tax=Madurella fahalii TaxID=1157608 RepID=A0ABQ0GN64_9PEZI
MDWDADDALLPFEQRDQEDQAEAWHNHPVRVQNRQLTEENMRLKKLLRENGISWDPLLTLDASDPTRTRGTWSSRKRIRTRSSKGVATLVRENCRLPTLPVEIQLFILEYAMTSKHPIIDPLCKLTRDNMTAAEKSRGNQIAIGFLATCKAYLVEGSRFLWSNNKFVFTTPYALRNFADLSLQHRKDIASITLRVIARYYDDEDRLHLAPYPSMDYAHEKTINLKVIPRIKEQNLARKGFRSYSWNQVVDFLEALRPPFDPNHPKTQSRPRLLPNLETLRMDFVNFPENFLTPPGGPSIHNLASHDLGSTLNELQLTGVPDCAWGSEVASQLSRMVKDDGLVLKGDSSFVYSGNRLRSMSDGQRWSPCWYPKVVRAWKVLADEYARAKTTSTAPQPSRAHRHEHAGSYTMPPAPKEEGHPESLWMERRTLFKRVPISQNSETREWIEFDRLSGQSIDGDMYDPDEDEYDVEDLICLHCGVMHSPFGDD